MLSIFGVSIVLYFIVDSLLAIGLWVENIPVFKDKSFVLGYSECFGLLSALVGTTKDSRKALNKMAADLTYEGCNFYRQRLVLSTLSGKSVRIKNIRSFDDDPGLKGMIVL